MQNKYGIEILFCDKSDTGYQIKTILGG